MSSFPRLPRCRAACLLALLVTCFVSGSATPTGTLVFVNPTGTVAPTDSIDVIVRLTLDPTSPALVTDQFGQLIGGLTGQEIEDLGIVTLTSAYVNVFFGCFGNFTTFCLDGPPYKFEFGGSMFQPANVNVQPGASLEYLFGTFTPSGGPVAPGTYKFYNTGVFITVNGLDATGAEISGDFDIAATCNSYTDDCSFERTVGGEIPEPGTYAMLLSGMGALFLVHRRRR